MRISDWISDVCSSDRFETVSEARRAAYAAAFDAELAETPPPPGYIAGDTATFERIHVAEARYNRALLYRSWNLHSGAIAPGAALSADPMGGRERKSTRLNSSKKYATRMKSTA